MKYDETQTKVDLLAAARKTAGVYVTQASPGADDTPEKILFDAKRDPKEMLDAYKERRAAFDTIPLDIEGATVRLFRGQWTIFSGYTGTGKTTYLRQLACHLIKAGRKIFVATLESDPEDYIIELASTAAGVEVVSEAQLRAFIDSYGAQLRIWGVIGVADHRKILATARDLATKEGLDYAIIDSLMMLDIEEDDIDEQRKFAGLLTATSITTGVHIVLVAHPKRPMDPDAAPTVHNVSGSAKLVNLAFNVLFIRRGPPAPGQDKNITQMELHVLKQRTRGLVGELKGYFYRHHNQFHLDSMAQSPTFYMAAENYPASGLTEDIPEHILNPNAFKVEPGSTNPWDVG
jgi:energy-coupling factor transporter ATP-binding protein EcfA2